jgi:hypothetical protein
VTKIFDYFINLINTFTYSYSGLGCKMESKLQEGTFCRIKNRIDLYGKVIKIDGKFARVELPEFRGNIEYPLNLLEPVELNNF